MRQWLVTLGLVFLFSSQTTAEEYRPISCYTRETIGAWEVMFCPLSIEPHAYQVVYFHFGEPIIQVPHVAPVGYVHGLYLDYIRLEADPARVNRQGEALSTYLKVRLYNESDEEVHTTLKMMLPRR